MNHIYIHGKIIPVLMGVLLLCSCRHDENTDSPEKQKFMENNMYGLYVKGEKSMRYEKYEYQTARNTEGTYFRLQNDNLSKVMACTFSEYPGDNNTIEVTLRTEGIPKVKNGTSVYSVEKHEGDMFWLWSESSQTGLIIMAQKR